MIDQLIVRQMEPGEEQAVSDLVRTVLNEFGSSDFSDEGMSIFLNFIDADCIRERRESGNCIILAIGAGIVGVLEIRDRNHITLFFVDKKFHGRGIAKKLLQTALLDVQTVSPEITKISVHSSPYAVPIYEKLGFHATDRVQIKNGIKYIPMTKLL